MKKTNYNITCQNGVQTVSGYVFYFCGLRFGVANDNKHSNGWTVTELKTGKAIGCAKTRKLAIDRLIYFFTEGNGLQLVRKTVDDCKNDVNPGLEPEEQYLTVKPFVLDPY